MAFFCGERLFSVGARVGVLKIDLLEKDADLDGDDLRDDDMCGK